jgi:Periplasmic protease
MKSKVSPLVLLGLLLLVSTAQAEEGKMCTASAHDCEMAIRAMLTGQRYLGVQLQELNPGLVVKAVSPQSPAERGDLRPGDRLIVVNGHSTTDATIKDFKQLLGGVKDTGRLWVIVSRHGMFKKLDVHLEPYSKVQIDKIVAQHLAQSHAIAATTAKP